MNYTQYNDEILNLISDYLNFNECAITKEAVRSITSCGVDELQAVRLLLASFINVNDKAFINEYFFDMLHKLEPIVFKNDLYYKNISFKAQKLDDWELKCGFYKPYELFVQDDFIVKGEKIIPNLGYFDKKFSYPAVYLKGRLWMSITPNEINAMKEPILKAHGKVLTFGLGLGYFAYMVSVKENVESVTIIEKDASVISLFRKCILPQFKYKEKIKIIESDAFEFLNKLKNGEYDFAFVDIYHDVGDGKEVYLKFKEKETLFSETEFTYWIEKSIKLYL